MSRRFGSLAVIALMFAGTGCADGGGGGGGGGGIGIAWSEYGGNIQLESYNDVDFPELYLDAFLVKDIDWPGSEPPRIKEPVIGDCEDFSDDGGSNDIPTLVYLDAGSELTATGAGVTIVADLFEDSGFQYDEGYLDSSGTGTFTISASGGVDVPAGVIGTITVPGPTTANGSPVVVPGEPLEVSYTAPANTVIVEIELEHSIEDIYWTCYADPNETSFTVPGSVTEHLDADAFIDVYGQWYQSVEIAGKTILLSGESSEF